MPLFLKSVAHTLLKGWRMIKSETQRDAEILLRNPNPRLCGKKFRESKKVKTNHAETRLRDLSKTLPRFRDPAKIFRDPRFLRYHSPPLIKADNKTKGWRKPTSGKQGPELSTMINWIPIIIPITNGLVHFRHISYGFTHRVPFLLSMYSSPYNAGSLPYVLSGWDCILQ